MYLFSSLLFAITNHRNYFTLVPSPLWCSISISSRIFGRTFRFKYRWNSIRASL